MTDTIKIHYKIELTEDNVEIFDLEFGAQTMEQIYHTSPGEAHPGWTDLDHHKCEHCPLSSDSHKSCPAAISLATVTSRFKNLTSHDKVHLTVTTEDRTIAHKASAQQAVSSLLGLLIATSGCPHTNFLKPMARFHLPLASEDDTVFRVAGTYLIAQYLLRIEGKDADLKLSGLTELYDNLHKVNSMLANRIRALNPGDTSINAVIILDTFTNLMPYVIDDQLDSLKPFFTAYLS